MVWAESTAPLPVSVTLRPSVESTPTISAERLDETAATLLSSVSRRVTRLPI